MSILYVTLYLIVLYCVEALHDSYVIKAGETIPEFNAKWHKVDSIFHLLIWVLIALLQASWIYVLLGALIRVTVFQSMLNLFRGSSFFYLSKHGMDALLTKVFGPIAPYITFIVGVAGIVAINIFF